MTTTHPTFDRALLDRMVLAVQLVRDRLLRSTQALAAAGVPYAVVGGNAVAAWVATVNPRAVRNTVDVDILLRRSDIPAAAAALAKAGFVHRHAARVDFFLDGPDGYFEEAVHVVRAGEKVRKEYAVPAPDLDESGPGAEFHLVNLAALVRMKLTSFRDKDRVHLRDMLGVGLIDSTWCGRYPPELAARLQELVDSPESQPDYEDSDDEIDSP